MIEISILKYLPINHMNFSLKTCEKMNKMRIYKKKPSKTFIGYLKLKTDVKEACSGLNYYLQSEILIHFETKVRIDDLGFKYPKEPK